MPILSSPVSARILALWSCCAAGCLTDPGTDPATPDAHEPPLLEALMDAGIALLDGGDVVLDDGDASEQATAPAARVRDARADPSCRIETSHDPATGELAVTITSLQLSVDARDTIDSASCFVNLGVDAPEGYVYTLDGVRAEGSADLLAGVTAGFAIAQGMSGIPEQFRPRQGMREQGPFAGTVAFESSPGGNERRYSRCGEREDIILWLALSLHTTANPGSAAFTRLSQFKLGVQPCSP